MREETVACIGAGVIGNAWAALFAARGYRVNVQDPDPAAAGALDAMAIRVAGVLDVPISDIRARLFFTDCLETALAGATFVQESAPESLELKQRLFADIDHFAPVEVVVASSTSDFPISRLVLQCRHPERLLIGHPINPPYAIPLVEVVGGPATSAAAVERACAFYRSVGKHPLRLDREVTGFLANRLQMAIAREALQMIAREEATVAQVDAALMHGIGPRIAAVGLFGGYALNIRDTDPAAWLDHIASFDFGSELVHRGPFPAWTPELQARVAAEWRARLADPGPAALRDRRDDMAVRIARLHDDRPAAADPHPAFAEDYSAARGKFRDAAQRAGATLEAHRLPSHDGPNGEPLFIDAAWLGPEDADVVVLSLSGTHGAEGFNGSAAQVHWLTLHGGQSLPKGVAMLFVHAVNPFGFAHMLRVNENNVDLNRNFIDFGAPPPANPVYAAIQGGLPRRTGLDEALVGEWDAAVAKAVAVHGDWAVANALSCGQYGDPDGVEYGGDALQWSSQTVIDIVTRLCKRARHVAYIDWHSLIPIGDGRLIFVGFDAGGDGVLHRRAGRWWGESALDPATVDAQWASGTSQRRPHHHGVMMWGLRRALAPRTDLAGALIEFCCDPDDFIHSPEPDTRTTMWERWLFASREYRSAAGQMAMRYLREAASPTRRSYQDAAMAAAMPVYRRAIDGAAAWAADNIAADCGPLIQSDAD